jgi:hypothetical protein
MLLAFLVLAQQAHSIPLFDQEIKYSDDSGLESANNTTEDEEDDSEKTHVAIDLSLISSNVQCNIHHVFYEIMDIEYNIEGEKNNIYQENIDSDSHLKILFRKVISPNAP